MTKDSCPSCGSVAQPGATRCVICGAWLGEAPTAPATPASAPPQAWAQPPQPTQPPQPGYQTQAPGVYPYPTYPSYQVYPGYQAPASGVYSYPTGNYAPYPSYAPSYGGYGGYGYPGYYAPAYPAYPAYPAKPRRTPSETYALVIAWIVTCLAGLSAIGGLIGSLFALIAFFIGLGGDLSFLGAIIGYSLVPILGGGFGLWYGIRGIMRRSSPSFRLPPSWMLLGLTLVAIGGAVALWNINQSFGRAPGDAFGVFPLAALTGALPALAILAFTSQRLHDPSSRRRVWMSLFYGMTLAPLIAVIVEGILAVVIFVALNLSGQNLQGLLSQSSSQRTPVETLAIILLVSVVAPLVEEGVKPLGALLAIRRLRAPGEAFLVGLAAGVGFDMFETIGYIGQGQADWVIVAIERIGAGLLHGVGAGMGALAWYYLINGKGVPLRWLRVAGFFLYAILQHSLFNALSVIEQILPGNVNEWLGQPIHIGALPFQRIDAVYLGVYALILTMLIFMTSRLPRAQGMPEPPPPAPTWPAGYPYAPYPAIPWGYGLGPAPVPAASAEQAPQTVGGAR